MSYGYRIEAEPPGTDMMCLEARDKIFSRKTRLS